MKFETIIKENLTLTNEKIKSMCRLNFEDNDFLYTIENGRNIILDKRKNIIYIEGSKDNIDIAKYSRYLQDLQEKRDKKIILTTLSPNTHRTSEENLGLSYLAAILRKNGYSNAYEILKGMTRGKKITIEEMKKFIEQLDINSNDKQVLLQLEPQNYVGLAEELVKRLSQTIDFRKNK